MGLKGGGKGDSGKRMGRGQAWGGRKGGMEKAESAGVGVRE